MLIRNSKKKCGIIIIQRGPWWSWSYGSWI